jgi:hypothetical protein
VSSSSRQFDPWRWPTLALWVLFFLVGLYPGLTFQWLREAGHVTTWSALVNSEHLITLMCAGFLAYFITRRAQDGGMPGAAARARGLVVVLISLTAFLPIRLDQFAQYAQVPVAGGRNLLYLVAATKCLTWLYLLSLVIQYYLVSGPKAFYRVPTLLPSVQELQGRHTNTPADTTSNAVADDDSASAEDHYLSASSRNGNEHVVTAAEEDKPSSGVSQ